MTLGNGQVWSSTLDQDGRLTSYTLGGVTYTVLWDAANRITAINHATTPSLNQGFGYDNLDRITSFTSTPRNQTFTYDLTGNLTAKTDIVGATQTDYSYSIAPTSNRMTGISNLGIGYTIDAVGNRTGDGRISYLYNARGRLYRVNIINGTITSTFNYLINGINQRVRKTGPSSIVPQGTQIFVYDDGGKLVGEYDNLGRARTEHVWVGDRPVAAITYTYVSTNLTPATTTVSYVETDHLGTPRLITNSSRLARWSWVSAPYGDTLANENPAALGVYPYNLRFAGQFFDKETNHHYNWHRDYESTSGRYLQSDPIGLKGGPNTYSFAYGTPTSNSDPYGLGPGLALACVALNSILHGYAVINDLRETSHETWLQKLNDRVNREIEQCPASNLERRQELQNIQRDLLRLRLKELDRSVRDKALMSFEHLTTEYVIGNGLCALLVVVPSL